MAQMWLQFPWNCILFLMGTNRSCHSHTACWLCYKISHSKQTNARNVIMCSTCSIIRDREWVHSLHRSISQQLQSLLLLLLLDDWTIYKEWQKMCITNLRHSSHCICWLHSEVEWMTIQRQYNKSLYVVMQCNSLDHRAQVTHEEAKEEDDTANDKK